jgi:uncharacterized integral membrane protein (TIGR00698 family)
MSFTNSLIRALAWWPGLGVALICAALAKLISAWTGVPAMVLALILGLSIASLLPTGPLAPGVDVATKPLLRLGVALLGAQLSFSALNAIGITPIILALVAVASTVLIGAWIARACGLTPVEAWISATSVGVCGASAALAAAAALPRSQSSERATILIVAGANILSTLAMVSYPVLAKLLYQTDHHIGILLGLSIHDVAQVVGAGLIISPAVAQTAALVKLVRVACLAPVVLALGLWTRAHADTQAKTKLPPLVPGFLLGFAALAILASLGLIPAPLQEGMKVATGWLLTIAVAGLGMKTSLKILASTKPMLAVAMILQSLLILGISILGLQLVLW